MKSSPSALQLKTVQKHAGNNQETRPSSQENEPPQSRREQLAGASSARIRNIRASCFNSAYHVFANLLQAGAVVGAAILTTAELEDRQKDAVGALTIGCVVLGTFCFWQLSCCSNKKQEPVKVISEPSSSQGDSQQYTGGPYHKVSESESEDESGAEFGFNTNPV